MLTALVVAALCTLTLPGASTGASAYWGDTARVTASPVRLGPLPIAPKQSAGTGLHCSASNGLLNKHLTYAWKGESWKNSLLTYSATVTMTQGTTSVSRTGTVSTQTGANDRAVVIDSSLVSELLASLRNLLGSLLGKFQVSVTVQASYAVNTAWITETQAVGSYNTGVAGLLSEYSCTP